MNRRRDDQSFTRREFLAASAASIPLAANAASLPKTTSSTHQSSAGFPEGFVWGAAAASYQVEGAATDDGKGPSVWDMFCRKSGAVWMGHTGDVACDHYHRYRDDVALMKELGVKAYRLSVSWPRVMPEGVGAVNPKGLDFYDKLVDELLKSGIEPFVTLFHWDFPLALYHRGGWLNRDSADWFSEYTQKVVRKLSDRVKHWMTFNEPSIFIGLGHQTGIHAPGDKLRFHEVLTGSHNVLLAHGKSVQAIRASSPSSHQVGFAFVGYTAMPATNSPQDVAIAMAAMASVRGKDCHSNTWWMDPIFFGRYPQDGLKLFESELPRIQPGDFKTINQPVDFIGTNIYQGRYFRAGAEGKPEELPFAVGHPITGFEWPVTPEVLYWGPRFLHERYKKPVYVTENGLSCRDWVSLDGKVHDPQRIDFVARHLQHLQKASRDGVSVKGYFHWSIMDNFEWGEGYKQRFGMVFVDYPTQKRIPKDSAYWYRDVIAANGKNIPPLA